VREVKMAREAAQDNMVQLVLLDPWAKKVPEVNLVQMALKVQQVLWEKLAKREQLDVMV
jgi:hypothetical protein